MSFQQEHLHQHDSTSFNQSHGLIDDINDAVLHGSSSSGGVNSPVADHIQTHGGHTHTNVSTTTMTMTETITTAAEHEVLQLTLRALPRVTWDENTLDNEGLGRKSSKRCCIFHKQRPYDESSTDSSDYESENRDDSSDDGDGKTHSKKTKNSKKIARPKKGNANIPDSQRFHA